MGISGRRVMREQIKGEIIAFVTGRRQRPTLNQILGTVRSYVLKNILTKEEVIQMLEEIEVGVKRGEIAPMNPRRIERFKKVEGAIKDLLQML